MTIIIVIVTACLRARTGKKNSATFILVFESAISYVSHYKCKKPSHFCLF